VGLRVEFKVTVGSAEFSAALSDQQAECLALALLRGVPPAESERPRLRGLPRRIALGENA
jgi:hypothetical protein